LEKASELGVSDLVPVTTQNTQWPLNHAAAQRQLVESAEQSERMSIASLHSPIHLSQLFAEWEPAHGGDSATGPPRDEGNNHFLLVCRERGFEQSRPLLSVLRELSKLGPGAPVRLLVGPEGGFTAAELAAMEKLPFVRFVSLGPTLLRSETAALAALAAVQLHQDSYEKPS
jgi:16S rRNA (uracil1498-N3)-methyltransferase